MFIMVVLVSLVSIALEKYSSRGDLGLLDLRTDLPRIYLARHSIPGGSDLLSVYPPIISINVL